MSVTITLKEYGAPGNTEQVVASSPANQSAFQTAAATAVSSQGSFLQITRQDNGNTELINLTDVKSVY